MNDRLTALIHLIFVVVVAASLFVSAAHAQSGPCAPEIARITSMQGDAELRWSETDPWRPAERGDVLCVGTTIRVGAFSRAGLVLINDSTLRLDQLTTLTIRGREQDRRTWLEMLTGAIHFFSHRPRALKIDTPFVNAAGEGTEFLIRLAAERAHIVMYEGIVLAENAEGELRLGSDDAALIRKGERPIPEIIVRPRDAVAWAVHYPPVLSDLADGGEPGAYPVALQIAIKRTRANNYPGALRTLDLVKPAERDARYEIFRASILLNVGRVEEAEAAIERALTHDPNAGDAYAQRSILHVVRNARAQALRDANRAVELAPASSAALIAQSYARQANIDLEGAKESLRQAVDIAPTDALAFARLSEIELSFGDLDKTLDAAAQAAKLAPDLARTQTILGFARLAEIDTDAAKQAFAKAIALYSADPLPHLGQGLAKIRDGALEAGRRDLEIAAGLDPNNALIRSYLGKAYFEEKRAPRDATQFEIAKQLDPNLPTPYLYDAIRKQTENNPAEALRDLETAIELNDNRAVYRSDLLLDRDLAARSVSLARVYDDLGFDQLALVEASKSLSLDPSNHSAHRFLSDAYARIPRYEIARVSELLRAQLLQPININPVQPSVVVTDLNSTPSIGPAETTFNEFHPLFERNRAQVVASGVIGNRDTFEDELVASALWDHLSFSIGQFHSETGGIRDNSDVANDLVDTFAQVAVSPALSIQTEYRHRKTEQGDILLRFDPQDFAPNFRRRLEDDIFRLGARYEQSPHSNFLISAFLVNRRERQTNLEQFDTDSGFAITSDLKTSLEDKGYQIETQYIYDSRNFDTTIGIGNYGFDVLRADSETITLPDGTNIEIPEIRSKSNRDQTNAYIYTDIQAAKNLDLSLSLGYSSLEQETLSIKEALPKFGLKWQITDALLFRVAALRTLNRAIAVNQTIEPTELAGFNQFFDDDFGSKADQYGIAIDTRIGSGTYWGLEFDYRDLSVPVRSTNINVDGSETSTFLFEDQNEQRLLSYLYWQINDNWSMNTKIIYDRFEGGTLKGPDTPEKLEFISVPLQLRYFNSHGFFAQPTVRLVHQDVEPIATSTEPGGSEGALLFDASVGYRLPNRRGIVSLDVQNLFDTNFRALDNNFRSSERRIATDLIPERSLFLRLTLNF